MREEKRAAGKRMILKTAVERLSFGFLSGGRGRPPSMKCPLYGEKSVPGSANLPIGAVRAVAKKNLQYPKTNPLFVIPAEAGTQGSVNDEKGRKPGEMGTKPTTSRPWVPACAGMTKKRLSQKENPFADSFWQTL
jgi:hypothetical protein